MLYVTDGFQDSDYAGLSVVSVCARQCLSCLALHYGDMPSSARFGLNFLHRIHFRHVLL